MNNKIACYLDEGLLYNLYHCLFWLLCICIRKPGLVVSGESIKSSSWDSIDENDRNLNLNKS